MKNLLTDTWFQVILSNTQLYGFKLLFQLNIYNNHLFAYGNMVSSVPV